MNNLRLPNFLIYFIFALSGCNGDVLELDTKAPQLVQVLPDSKLRAEGETIELHFSEPVVNVKKSDTCFRLAKTDSVSASLLLSSSKSKSLDKNAAFVPLTSRLSQSGDTLFLSNLEKLEFDQGYSLWVFDCLRDYAGNALMLSEGAGAYSEYRFKVESGPFELVAQDVLSKPDARVPPNRKYFHFTFSHKVAELPKNAVNLDDQSLQLTLSEDQFTLRAVLEGNADTCERMQPDASHVLTLSGIRDENGKILPATSFNFVSERACLLRKANLIGRPRVFAYESYVEFAFDSPLLAVAQVHFRSDVADFDCLGSICPQYSPQLMGNGSRLRLDELTPDKLFRYTVDVEDLYGEHAQLQGQFETRKMATIAINEIMANPKILDGRREAVGEFVELYNYGDEAVDLSGFSLEVGSKSCTLNQEKTPLTLQGRSYMLLVGAPFVSDLFGLVDGPEIHRMQGQTICGNLRNWPLPSVVLRDDRNRILDEFSEMPKAKGEGISIERLNAEAKNEKGQFCYSRKDIGPTPLGENGVVRKGCEN